MLNVGCVVSVLVSIEVMFLELAGGLRTLEGKVGSWWLGVLRGFVCVGVVLVGCAASAVFWATLRCAV